MLNNKKRGILASAGAFVTAVALAFSGAAAAQAAPQDSAPEKSGLVITKVERPAGDSTVTNGSPLGALPGEPINGVTFEAYKVPLNTKKDATSNDAQAEIAGIDLAEAKQRVADSKGEWGGANKRSGETAGNGEIQWTGAAALDAGLWLVRETGTPAGVVAAGDFLVALPLTNPQDKSQWLDTVYVYPKNHTIEGTKSVQNADQLVVGDVVTWTVAIENPSPRDPATGAYVAAEMFEITDELAADFLSLAGGLDGVSAKLSLKDQPDVALTAGADYTKSLAGNTVTVAFTAQGLEKLAANQAYSAIVELQTTVLKSGSIKNVAQFSTSKSQPKANTTEADVKYGDFELIKKSEGGPSDAPLAGAEFMVFADKATADAALKGDTGAREAALKPEAGSHADGVWTTDDAGKVMITGLRFSDYADGEKILEESKQLTYWLVETKALENHQLLTEPVPFKLTDASKSIEVTNQYDRGGFVLPLTGGTGTIMLTVAGVALLALVLIVARRRQHAAE